MEGKAERRGPLCAYGELCFNFLVAWNKELHDTPSYEVSDAADTEYDEVTCGLAGETEERHLGLICVNEEDTRAVVDQD